MLWHHFWSLVAIPKIEAESITSPIKSYVFNQSLIGCVSLLWRARLLNPESVKSVKRLFNIWNLSFELEHSSSHHSHSDFRLSKADDTYVNSFIFIINLIWKGPSHRTKISCHFSCPLASWGLSQWHAVTPASCLPSMHPNAISRPAPGSMSTRIAPSPTAKSSPTQLTTRPLSTFRDCTLTHTWRAWWHSACSRELNCSDA